MRRAFVACLVLCALAGAAAAPASAGTPGATVTVAPQGNGSGVVTARAQQQTKCSYKSGAATGTCSAKYPAGATVTFDAAAGDQARFGGWERCPGTVTGASGARCTITVQAGPEVVLRASFIATRRLRVRTTGDGRGTVLIEPGAITCKKRCTASFDKDVVVSLTARPSLGSTFDRWGSGCAPSGKNPVCSVSLAVNQSVTVNFDRAPNRQLKVRVQGEGTGTVTSTPAGIVCPDDCSKTYKHGTTVKLTANAGPGSTFTGWAGACTGAGDCSVTLSQAISVTATFDLTPVQAELTGWHTSRTDTGRVTRVNVSAEELVSFNIRIVRRGRVVVARQVRNFKAGRRAITLRIPNSAAPGKAQLQVTFINRYSATKSQSGPVKIPSLG